MIPKEYDRFRFDLDDIRYTRVIAADSTISHVQARVSIDRWECIVATEGEGIIAAHCIAAQTPASIATKDSLYGDDAPWKCIIPSQRWSG
jgi:hypothetical protein